MKRAKKILWWLVLAFAVYAIFKSPDQAAQIVRTVWDIVVTAFNAIITFFNRLLTGK